jgi:Flp pilus assembly protein TadG
VTGWLRTRAARRARAFGRDERGAAVVEFALVLPILMLLVFMFIDAARGFYTVNSLVASAREGARQGSARITTCPASLPDENAVKDRVIASAMMFGGAQVTRAMVQVTMLPAGGPCESVRVRINNYPFRTLTPINRLLGADSILISREAEFRWERAR